MAKISELTTLTAPVTSSDLTVMIRPNAGGGYSSFKSSISNIGNLKVTSSLGVTGSVTITGSESIIISGSGFLGTGTSTAYVGPNKVSNYGTDSNGYGRTELGINVINAYKTGLNIWSSGSVYTWGSGSTYMWYNIGQSKTPYGGVSQYGYIVRSQYQGTTVGSSSYNSVATASQALWVCRPTFNDQTDAYGSSPYMDAFDANHPAGNTNALVFRIITGSSGGTPWQGHSLSIGVDDNSYSTGTYSGVASAGAGSALRMLSGSIYAPSSFGFRLGNFGGISYTNHTRLGFDLNGDGYIALGTANASSLLSTPNVSASLALYASNGNIVISTGFGGVFSGYRTIFYGSQSTTGSINSTGYINLPRGSSDSLPITVAAELFTGSMAFDTSSMNMVVFTGDGATTFNGTDGWKIVTLT